jgi:hypothetical protein
MERAALRSGRRNLGGGTGVLRHCGRLQRNGCRTGPRRFHRSGRWEACSRSARSRGDAGCSVRIRARLIQKSAGRYRGSQSRRGFRRVRHCHGAVLHRGSDTAHLSGSRRAVDPTRCANACLQQKEGNNDAGYLATKTHFRVLDPLERETPVDDASLKLIRTRCEYSPVLHGSPIRVPPTTTMGTSSRPTSRAPNATHRNSGRQSQLPANPARRKPLARYGQCRVNRHNKPVR